MNSTYSRTLLLLLGFTSTSGIADNFKNPDDNPPPAIFIERIIDKSEIVVPQIKMQYDWCVTQKRVAQKAYREKSVAWPAMAESLGNKYVLNIRADPVPEPDWKRLGVGISTEEEYFYGIKYAVIRHGKKFRISENDGRCRLIVYGEYEKQDIDNGKFRYKVTLRDKAHPIAISGGPIPKILQFKHAKVIQSISPVRVRQTNDENIKKLTKAYPERILSIANKLFSRQVTHLAVPRTASRTDAEPIKDAFKLDERISSERHVGPGGPGGNADVHVAGQLCDIVQSKVTKVKLYYWHKMHYYPSIMERPIILKSIQRFAHHTVVEKATRFEVRKRFKDEIFEPPPGITVTKAIGPGVPVKPKGSAIAPPIWPVEK